MSGKPDREMWLVKIYEVVPKAEYYLGENEWTDQRGAKRFPSKEEARAAAREHDGAVLARLKTPVAVVG